jgi:hypothetical protein
MLLVSGGGIGFDLHAMDFDYVNIVGMFIWMTFSYNSL